MSNFIADGNQSVTIGPSGLIIGSKDNVDASILSNDIMKGFEFDTSNGGKTDTYFWSQDRYEVVIKIIIPVDTKSSLVGIKLIDSKIIHIGLKGVILLSKELKYGIHFEENSGIDWELLTTPDNSCKYLQLVLPKKSPIPGSFIWWKCVFIGDDEIDVSSIKGRAGTISHSTWAEAHSKFEESVKSINPTYLDEDEVEESAV